jgi:uncharacterized damage-inducible protein DinB
MTAYTDRILALLGERKPEEVLADTPSRLEDAYWELKDKKLGVPFGEGKWTARQILAHLVDVEAAFAFRVRLALTAEHPTLQPYDQDAFVGLYKGIDASLAVEVFRSLRTWNLELVRSLTPEQTARGAFHPERGEEPVSLMLALLAGHDLNHLAQLEAIARG